MRFFACPIFPASPIGLFVHWRAIDKEVAPRGQLFILEAFSALVSKYAIDRNFFGDLYLWCEGRFLEIDRLISPHASSTKLKLASLNLLMGPTTRLSFESNLPDASRSCFNSSILFFRFFPENWTKDRLSLNNLKSTTIFKIENQIILVFCQISENTISKLLEFF